MDDDALLTEQMAYYRAGAAEYDRPYAEHEDLQRLLAVVDELPIAGDVLELACGTGQWTTRLAARAHSVTAVDAAAEVLALARARTASPIVQFLEADLFEWQPRRRYDTVFFAFWLSHVPPTRLPDFWNTVAAALAPGGKVIFIDDGPAVAAYEEVLTNQPTPAALRRLDDGSQYRIVKVFHDAQTLTDDLTALGWSVRIRSMAGNYIGIAEPPISVGEDTATSAAP
ncbi:class I SAM-dependent methyltransferase [Streptomyces sp. NBC_00121]|uniref:class I SAM-dependent methyltransferase n=1 Tax=unclassified Streptomyces TaxID=2593676 RepID=UPI002DD8C3F4|nr:class I SAM-dependent methyltransferase [Streptomyces sp. NBC_01760]WSC72876.1 class I SAM-dependent methyltransferase [Streptomyces sp. NBC_01760]WTI90604.1 class I SAM-dependent methyltransferase [Streptomyces sp. NBC_00724]